MHSSCLFIIFAILASTIVSSTLADVSTGCPAKVAVILNKQQTAEYLESSSFSLHKRMDGEEATHSGNIESIKSICGAQHLDFTHVANLKDDISYVISGGEGTVEKTLEHIQAIVKDYVVVLDRKVRLQKRQQINSPSAATSPRNTPSRSNSIAAGTTSSSTVRSASVVAPGPTTNPGKNVSRAELLRSKFWTVGLLTGLLTTFILVLILLVGICWLASIEGPTRFENVKQKRS